jgi:hypothetical protein
LKTTKVKKIQKTKKILPLLVASVPLTSIEALELLDCSNALHNSFSATFLGRFEDLASHDKRITRKLNSIIKINKLTKESKFQAPKTQKNVKMTKNSALGVSPPCFSREKNGIYNPKLGFEGCWTRVKQGQSRR